MRKITYRGAEQIIRIMTSSKNTYVFEQNNGFTVLASSWADYYEILSYDSTHKSLVDSKDPLAETDMRRKSMADYEVPKEIYEEQIKRDLQAKADALYKKNVQAYKNSIYDKIASGILEAIPETIEADAIAHADKLAVPEVTPEITETPVPPLTPEETTVPVPPLTPEEELVPPTGDVVPPSTEEVPPEENLTEAVVTALVDALPETTPVAEGGTPVVEPAPVVEETTTTISKKK